MTAYQRKRQILNKINARTRAVSKKYGIDRHLLAEQAIDGLDGVYIDETYGTINITKGFESEEMYKVLEKNVLTATQAENKAMKKYENFIGPLQANTAEREVKAMYEYESDIDDIVKEYYELEAIINANPWNDSKAFHDFGTKLSEIGRQWHDDNVPYSILQDLLDDIKQVRGGL